MSTSCPPPPQRDQQPPWPCPPATTSKPSWIQLLQNSSCCKTRSKSRSRQPSNSVALAAHVIAAPETQRNPTPTIRNGGTILAAQSSTKPGLSADQGPRPRPRLLRLGLRALEGPTGNTKHGVTLPMRVPPYSARVALCVCLVCLSVCPVMPPPYPSCQVQTRTSSLGRRSKQCTWFWPSLLVFYIVYAKD